jgi:two-component sensor histidine kinase
VEYVPRTYVPLSRLKWLPVLGIFAVLFVSFFAYKYLDFVTNGEHISPWIPLLDEASGVIAACLLFPVCYWVAIRYPLFSHAWKRHLAIHFTALCLLSFGITTLQGLERAAVFPLFGLGRYHYGYLPARYPMEFAKHFIFYWVGVSLIYLFHELRFAREHELQRAKLETSLAETQLRNLQLQLEPHFLFNALNAISAAVYEDPRKADEMIGQLSEMLRQLLRIDRAQEVPLARELELLHLYTRIMQTRLEDRLQLSIEVDDDVREALVPQLLLQPLVENAIRHGMDPCTFDIAIEIRAYRMAAQLHLVVRDHGPGFDPLKMNGGIGLRNTAERLRRLYGERQRFETRNAADAGAVVELSFLYRSAASDAIPPPPECVPA